MMENDGHDDDDDSDNIDKVDNAVNEEKQNMFQQATSTIATPIHVIVVDANQCTFQNLQCTGLFSFFRAADDAVAWDKEWFILLQLLLLLLMPAPMLELMLVLTSEGTDRLRFWCRGVDKEGEKEILCVPPFISAVRFVLGVLDANDVVVVVDTIAPLETR
jgi:hypothetical protein